MKNANILPPRLINIQFVRDRTFINFAVAYRNIFRLIYIQRVVHSKLE